jgi:hypothetical protein
MPRTTPTIVTKIYLYLRTVSEISTQCVRKASRAQRNRAGPQAFVTAYHRLGTARDSTIHFRAQSMLFLRISFRTDRSINHRGAYRVRLFSTIYTAAQREFPQHHKILCKRRAFPRLSAPASPILCEFRSRVCGKTSRMSSHVRAAAVGGQTVRVRMPGD